MKQKEKSLSQDLTNAVRILKSGGVIVFPTDTVYGIGCVFDNVLGIDRIYKIKGTKKSQRFPILISSQSQIEQFATVNESAKKLMKKYWPGGLTILMKSKSGNEKLGFRMPNSKLALKLISKVGKPIIGTSANFHGKDTPTSYEELDPQFVKRVDAVIVGDCKDAKESTVVDTTFKPPKILRQGAVNLSQLTN